jgi:multicomponent Na+:H+ antiporter subunit G|tara:strand:- start:31 stop:348 length:318 start_codon:yes stop_codon:yes gene_type:complete
MVQVIMAQIAIGCGLFFIVVGAVGVLRMPDVYTRLHAAGMTDTMGAGFLLIGLALNEGLTLIAVRLILIWIFLLFTSPVSTHALARAALHAGIQPLQGEKQEVRS